MKITELTAEDVGRRVSFTGDGWQVHGVLSRLDSELVENTVDERSIMDPEPVAHVVSSYRSVTATVAGWTKTMKPADKIKVVRLD